MPIKNILLVDDSSTDRHVIGEMLARAGYAVVAVASAEEALARVAASGRATGLHLGLTCSRWLDVRPALLDLLDVRL